MSEQVQRLAGWALDWLGRGAAQRDWVRFVGAASTDSALDPALIKIQRYLGELVQHTKARNAREFVANIDVAQVSRAIGLPLRTVKVVRDKLSESLDRFEKS